MKTILYSVLFCLLVFSCKKQVSENPQPLPPSGYDAIGHYYLKNVQDYLKGRLNESSYRALNWKNAVLSKEQSGWYLRLGYGQESMAERFLLLTSDSSGNVSDGREVNLTRDPLIDYVFNGRIEIKDLQGKLISSNVVNNGYRVSDRIRQPGGSTVNSVENMFLVPAVPIEELPEVVVVGYYDAGGISLGDYIFLSGLGGSGFGGAGSGSGNAGGGGGSADGGNSGTISAAYSILRPAGGISSPASRTVVGRPTTISVETSYTKPGINLMAYLKCFSNIPDGGASYSVALLVDLPVNDDPTQVFNPLTGAVGHCFLGLTKSGSGQTVTQYFGFTSTRALAAIVGTVTPGKVVDNGGHKYNGLLTIPVTAGQFGIAMNEIASLSSASYDLNKFNCVDFSLSVVNSFRPTTPIIPLPAQMPGGGLSINTPQGLYQTLQHIQNAGGTAVTGSIWNAGSSHGQCN